MDRITETIRIACFGARGKVITAFHEGLMGPRNPFMIDEPMRLTEENFILLGRPGSQELSGGRYERQGLGDADIIAIGVKPDDAAHVAAELAGKLRPHQVVVSFAALVPLAEVQHRCRHEAVVRVMPTLGMKIRMSDTAYYGDSISAQQEGLVAALFNSLGAVTRVQGDEAIDAYTLDAACMLGCLAEALQYFCDAESASSTMNRYLAPERIMTNVLAAACLVLQGKYPSLGNLAKSVATPNGITAEMLDVFRRSKMAEIIAAAYSTGKTTLDRKRELRRPLGDFPSNGAGIGKC